MRLQSGFTLIEIMIAVAIVGILAAVAIPAFDAYRVRANRAAAQTFLSELFERQERVAIQQRAYSFCPTNPCTAAELDGVMDSLGMEVPAQLSNEYDVNVRQATVTGIVGVDGLTTLDGYEARLTPRAGSRQQGAGEGALTINQFGLKTVRNQDNTVRGYW